MWIYFTENPKTKLRSYQSGVFTDLEDIVPQIQLVQKLASNDSTWAHLALNLTTMSWYHYDDGEWSWIGDSVFQQK